MDSVSEPEILDDRKKQYGFYRKKSYIFVKIQSAGQTLSLSESQAKRFLPFDLLDCTIVSRTYLLHGVEKLASNSVDFRLELSCVKVLTNLLRRLFCLVASFELSKAKES